MWILFEDDVLESSRFVKHVSRYTCRQRWAVYT